jgi:hypothetical protein
MSQCHRRKNQPAEQTARQNTLRRKQEKRDEGWHSRERNSGGICVAYTKAHIRKLVDMIMFFKTWYYKFI